MKTKVSIIFNMTNSNKSLQHLLFSIHKKVGKTDPITPIKTIKGSMNTPSG